MRKFIILVSLFASVYLCACNMNNGEVRLSQEEYEKLLEMAEKNADEESLEKEEAPVETTTPTPTPTPTPTEAPAEIKYDLYHFDTLNIDLPVPDFSWTKESNSPEAGIIYRDNDIGGGLELWAQQIEEDIDDRTGEPAVYDQYYIDDCDPEDVISWSDKDNFFNIHVCVRDVDTFVAVRHMDGYNIGIKLMCKSEDKEQYEEAFDYVCQAMKDAEPELKPRELSLLDIDLADSYRARIETGAEDVTGKRHDKALCFHYINDDYDGQPYYAYYYPMGEYKTFSGDIAYSVDRMTIPDIQEGTRTMSIIGDDKELLSMEVDRHTPPTHFEVDITGVNVLKIFYGDGLGAPRAMIVNAVLTR